MSVQELTRLLTELAVDEVEADIDPWSMEVSSANIIVSATTRDIFDDEETAWQAARKLWRTVLDLDNTLTDEGQSELGAVRWQDQDSGVPRWRGKVRMILSPV
jgi:hypothetical protein